MSEHHHKKKHLVLVVNRFYPEVGGAEINVYLQSQELAKHYSVSVLSPERQRRKTVELFGAVHVKRFFNVFNPFRVFPYIRSIAFCPGMIWWILANRPDYVMGFPSLNPNTLVIIAVCRLLKIKFILCSFDLFDYSRILKGRFGFVNELFSTYKANFIRRWAIKNCDFIFTISNRERDFFRRYNSRCALSIVPAPQDDFDRNYTDPRPRYGVKADEFVFLCVGRLSEIKGQDIAIRAFLSAMREHSDWRLVVIGRSDYEPGFSEELYQDVARAGASDRVCFVGEASRDEVVAWGRSANIHVIPVRFMNSGAVVIEAWLSGAPVIQSDAVDPNYVIDGDNGFIFPSENVDGLRRKMVEAYELRLKLPEMGRRGRLFAIEKFSYSELIKDYNRTFESLSKEGGISGSP